MQVPVLSKKLNIYFFNNILKIIGEIKKMSSPKVFSCETPYWDFKKTWTVNRKVLLLIGKIEMR